jgi:hypothetical protein
MSLYLCPEIFYLIIIDESLWIPELSTTNIQQWCTITEKRYGRKFKTTNIYIIGNTKTFNNKKISNEIMNIFKERQLEFKWSNLNLIKIPETNIIEIIKLNRKLTSSWKKIYYDAGFENIFFENVPVESKNLITKEKFNFLSFTITDFPYRRVTETFYYLQKLNIISFQKLEDLLLFCIQKTKTPSNIPNHLLLENILNVKWKYRHWVIAVCDKNSNLQLPMCPVQYYNDMKRMFIKNTDMFKIVTSTETESKLLELNYLISLQKQHKKVWSHLGKMKRGELPTAYTLPKFSDIDKKLEVCRVRPIITYAKFSMKKTLSLVAIGLNYLISRLDPKQHYDINDSMLVKKKIEKINENLPFGITTKVLTLQADIETMFDRVEPGMVKDSIEWLFLQTKKIKRTDRIAIDFQNKTARFGRSYGEHYEMKFEEIWNIIEYMLKNSYVRIGRDYIALQIKGLPQGAPPSPPLARLVCIKREWEWNTLLEPKHLLRGMRFMDDLYMLFFYNNTIKKR